MRQVSALTCKRYGKKTPYFVPPTFLYKQKNGITPHICQIVALSQVTGYRFADWMNVCGFDLKLILSLQLAVHTERTAIVTPIDAVLECDSSLIPWRSRPEQSNRRYFFAKIGSRDAVLYPKILPGSVVRADRCYSPHVLDGSYADDLLWLVEHPGGLACCHVKRVDNEHIVLLPNRPPLSAWPLRLSREARILGLVDLELRPRQSNPFDPMYIPKKSELLTMPPHAGNGTNFSRLLRLSRARTGLTLRAAHQMTIRVAQLLRNRDYSIPLGLLSDYEAMNKLPRHIAKIMSLCIIYGIDFWEMMEAGGSRINDSDKSHLFISPLDESNDLLRTA
ncbi:MAG: hypothetical protein JWN74_2957 [Acidobacteriaceae bacterium]|nr:hypothetical protein [Acidobacteriaceae bacterium]